MRAGQIYRNKFYPKVRVRILWVSGDECEFEPADEYSEEPFDYFVELRVCLISELLELYENEEWS